MLYLYFCGLCMGAADLIPGISGGTIAFIMGFYTLLLEGLKSINFSSLKLLFTGNYSKFFNVIHWKVLLPLGLGLTTAFVCFTEGIHYILQHETYRDFLYATFTGLILGSTLFCMKQVVQWNLLSTFFLFMGFVGAWSLTGALPSALHLYEPVFMIDPWLIFCGALAICAMLLPGISGSYILALFGVYPAIIQALTYFLRSARQGVFDSSSFFVLLSLLMGIVIGLLTFARVVSWLLRYYADFTLSVLIGFMLGGIRSIVPFSVSHVVSNNTVLSLFLILGIGIVLVIEWMAQRKIKLKNF